MPHDNRTVVTYTVETRTRRRARRAAYGLALVVALGAPSPVEHLLDGHGAPGRKITRPAPPVLTDEAAPANVYP